LLLSLDSTSTALLELNVGSVLHEYEGSNLFKVNYQEPGFTYSEVSVVGAI